MQGSSAGVDPSGGRTATGFAAAAEDSGSTSADEMTCSICLQHTELEEIASISPGCGHSYCGAQSPQRLCARCTFLHSTAPIERLWRVRCDCVSATLTQLVAVPAVKCILRWAAHREHSTCPQCKAPFDYLLTYYRLDGTLNDFPCEESVTLLKRARFFTDHMQVAQNLQCWTRCCAAMVLPLTPHGRGGLRQRQMPNGVLSRLCWTRTGGGAGQVEVVSGRRQQ